ncbi:cytochrome c [Roseomonas terrae]|uniref:Cytochrome c n=1 Tax=Neoroseomonas terrae TaxID=424799 RepID=A0ABS5EGP1_9PROT|nr:cytochrome c [Neoroseomonas terrae]MBR0650199.1 cytochrome c [Neoroseomonas terrae]
MTRALATLLLLLAACDGWPESAPPPPPSAAPEGAIPRGEAARRAALAPPGPPVDAALLAEGAERYAIFCTPCHGAGGQGDGVVVARGHPAIPPLPGDVDRTMAAIAGNLAGAHPVADRLDPRQRWAVARYIATLRGE